MELKKEMKEIGSRKHLVIVVALLLAAFGTMALANYCVSLKSLRTEIALNELPLTGDTIYSEIQRDLLRPIFIASLMAQDTFLRDWVLDGERDKDKITRYLREIQQRYGTVTSFFVSEETKTYYHTDGILKRIRPDQWRDEWYYRVRALESPYEINVDVDMANRDALTIFINYKVFDYAGNFIGATGVGLTVNAVTRLIEEYQARYDRAIYFCDRNGRITLAGNEVSDGEMDLQGRDGMVSAAEEVLAGDELERTYYHQFRRDGEMVHLDSRFIPEFGWFLLVEQGEGEATQAIRRALLVNLLSGGVITVVVLLLIWVVVRTYEKRLEKVAVTDSLTGIANRFAFETYFDRTIRERTGKGGECSLLIIDLDHFKRINDTYDHLVGDQVICHLTAIIQANIRESDAFGRWGGEEFIILLKDVGLHDAFAQAERIRLAVKGSPYHHEGERIPVTISIGVAACRFGQGEEKHLFARADRALYRAKDMGRDRTESDGSI